MSNPDWLLTDEERENAYISAVKALWANHIERWEDDFYDYDQDGQRGIAKAQAKKLVEWLMRYKDINLEDEIPGDKTTVFFIPNAELKALLKEVGD